ncbi:hypothetical protein M405DRAFT_829951 [Rhizopogon salebrosus TDB-379]|nr:hypothetical protein M405DRAFT_829951 [Rhizopogon salebrosus TDB-379]
MPSSAQDVRAKFKRFRILVVGRANAGKTTLLQKVYNATGKPEIFDGKGNKVDPLLTQHRHYLPINHGQINADVVKPSIDVSTLVSSFMTRADSKLEIFVSERASGRESNECIHTIWQAIVSMRLYLIVRTQNPSPILRCTPRSLKELHWTQASLVDETASRRA